MVIALWVIAALIFATAIFLYKFMKDMARVEDDLITEIRQMKEWLKKINEKQL
jgi:uncharacterized membrane protein YqhA